MSDEPPGEVVFAHPDAEEDVVLPDGAEWTLVDRIPPGAVRGHVTTPASVVRAKKLTSSGRIPSGALGDLVASAGRTRTG